MSSYIYGVGVFGVCGWAWGGVVVWVGLYYYIIIDRNSKKFDIHSNRNFNRFPHNKFFFSFSYNITKYEN